MKDGEREKPTVIIGKSSTMTKRVDGKITLICGAGCVGPGWGNGRAAAVRFVVCSGQRLGIGIQRLCAASRILLQIAKQQSDVNHVALVGREG